MIGIMEIVDQLRPLLFEVAMIIITALAAMAMKRFTALTGIQIEARHREALQSALANAARLIVSGRRDAEDGMAEAGAERWSAVEYVERSVPDALRHFGIHDDARILDLLEPHISRLRS